MDELAQGVLNRITLALNTNQGLSRMSNWLVKYTRLDGKPFSFDDHEMQIQICNDTNARVVVQKCSQVGLSELSARKAAGTAAMTKGKHLIYVLPTRTFASKFSASRMTPIIDSSPMLSQMTNKAVKSTELKKIGDSFLHMGGTSGSVNGAISVPASFIFQDEVDFSADISVLSKYESRLKHAQEDEHGRKGHVVKFSTPTVPEYGINADFMISDQKHYNCRCNHCEHSFAPDYFRDIRIPGYNGKMEEINPADIKSGRLNVQKAYMACPSCGKDVWKALCDPERRAWVAKYPDRIISGYQVHPWDVPKVNSIPSILMQMPEYVEIADFYNFTIGIPWLSQDNSFNLAKLEDEPHAPWLNSGQGEGAMFMGVDVGKVSNIVIGRMLPDGTEEINYLEEYAVAGDKLPLYKYLAFLAKHYQVRCTVIDAAPDFTTALETIKQLPLGRVFACEYAKQLIRGLEMMGIPDKPQKAEEHVIKVFRTGSLQEMMRAHNLGLLRYPDPKGPGKTEMETVRSHLKNTKKLRLTNADGELEERFVNTGPDHYAHAINYMRMAMKIAASTSSGTFSYRPNVSKFKMRSRKPKEKLLR